MFAPTSNHLTLFFSVFQEVSSSTSWLRRSRWVKRKPQNSSNRFSMEFSTCTPRKFHILTWRYKTSFIHCCLGDLKLVVWFPINGLVVEARHSYSGCHGNSIALPQAEVNWPLLKNNRVCCMATPETLHDKVAIHFSKTYYCTVSWECIHDPISVNRLEIPSFHHFSS